MLENTERAIKNGLSRETGNIGYKDTRRRQNNKITQHRNIKSVLDTKTCTLLLITGG